MGRRHATGAQDATPEVHLTGARMWQGLEKASFPVIRYVTPAGKPPARAVMSAALRPRLYVATDAEGWKARQIADGCEVAVCVPIGRGGLLSLMAPIPPATVTFQDQATVNPASSLNVATASKKLASLQPPDRHTCCVLEMAPTAPS